MINEYLLLKSLHILGVIIFLGNIIITGYWKVAADFSRDARIIAYAQRQVTYTDILFTTLGVILILVPGLLMAHNYYGDFWQVKWIAWGLGLFIASGMIWVVILIPLQIIQHKMANEFSQTGIIPNYYWRLESLWMIFGILATLLPLMNIYWMVFKPV